MIRKSRPGLYYGGYRRYRPRDSGWSNPGFGSGCGLEIPIKIILEIHARIFLPIFIKQSVNHIKYFNNTVCPRRLVLFLHNLLYKLYKTSRAHNICYYIA